MSRRPSAGLLAYGIASLHTRTASHTHKLLRTHYTSVMAGVLFLHVCGAL